jgi:predicted SAM-dependent methyltransferase
LLRHYPRVSFSAKFWQDQQNRRFLVVKAFKNLIVTRIGREKANRLSAPFYDWQARRRTRRLLAELPDRGLLVHLGCGPRSLKGWVNVDISRNEGVDVVWDLRNGMPFTSGSCSAIFSEHMIEHVPREAAAELMKQCADILEPGGVLRVSTPDAALYLRAYVESGDFLTHPAFTEPAETPLDRINHFMREYGQHLWVYDAESLILLMRKAGFSSASEREFGSSSHPEMEGLDSEERAFESLYVEAVK